jgi:hypothetical protein
MMMLCSATTLSLPHSILGSTAHRPCRCVKGTSGQSCTPAQKATSTTIMRYHSRALQHRFGRFRCYRLLHCRVCQSISRRQQEPPGRTAYDEHTAATTESDRACRAFIVSPLTVSTIQAGVVKCTHRSDISPPAAFIVPVSVPQDPGRSKEEVALCWSIRAISSNPW